jgi:L-cysteine/cystine lyase
MGSVDSFDALRSELPVLARCVYLNTGSAGPLPTSVADAIRRAAEAERYHGRGDFGTFGPFLELRERVRARMARLLGADADEIALTHHTSEGVNIVLWGLGWKPGDRLVTTTLEHDAVVVPVAAIARRFGVAGIEQALAAPTKLLVLSHVSYSSGALLPVAEITRLAHARGAAVLVDGAQSVGAMPVAVRELGVDYYTASAQKWLCGPEGLGALYVRRDRLAELEPTFCGYFGTARNDFRGQVVFHQDARRFEFGMVYRPSLAGFDACLEWMLERVGVERAWQRSLELGSYARGLLGELGSVAVVTPAAQQSQLVSFDLPGFPPAALRALASRWGRERKLVVRSIDHPPCALRVSVGWFNLASELELLVEAVAEAVAEGPAAVAERSGERRAPREAE